MTLPVITDRKSLEDAVVEMLNRKSLAGQVSGMVRLADATIRQRAEVGRGLENNPVYRQALPPLGPHENSSVWLLVAHPALYLYQSLVHAQAYVKDEGRIPVWQQMVEVELAAIRRESRRLGNGVLPRVTHDHPTNESGLLANAPVLPNPAKAFSLDGGE